MIDCYEIKNSVFEWLNIELKFVDDGMVLRMKITHTIWQYKNTSITRINGGFIQISKVLIPCHSDIVLISSKHIVYLATITTRSRKEPFVPTYSYKHKQWQLAQRSSLGWWNWQGSWWSSYNSESQEGGERSLEWTGWPVTGSFCRELSKMDFTNSICFDTDGSFKADGGLL